MPYTEKQLGLFRAMAHNDRIARKHGMSKEEALDLLRTAISHSKKKRRLKNLSHKTRGRE